MPNFFSGLAQAAVKASPYALQAIKQRDAEKTATEQETLRNLYAKNADNRAERMTKVAENAGAIKDEGEWEKAEPFAQDDGSTIMAQRNKRTGVYRPASLGEPSPSSAIPSSAMPPALPRVSAPMPGDSQDMTGGSEQLPPQAPSAPKIVKPSALKPFVKPSTTPPRPASMTPGTPEWRAAKKDEAEIGAKYGYHPPQSPTITVLPGANGAPAQAVVTHGPGVGSVSDLPSVDKSAGGGRSVAAITKALANNQQQLSIIDDAIKELDAYPDAVGLQRGLPFIGDKLDQRRDPKGIAARASIANIGSLQIHDRTGAAMTAREEPRLAPFVPNVGDTPEAIRIKLTKLKAAIGVETDALSHKGQSTGGGRGGGAGTNVAHPANAGDRPGDIHAASDQQRRDWDAAAAHLKAQGKDPVAEIGPRP